MTLVAGPDLGGREPRRAARAHRRPGRMRGLWEASPLTYLTLIVALVLSVFPVYWMIIVATRGNDIVGDVPPPMLPGGELGKNLGAVFDAEEASFAKGLVNSAVVATSVTVSTVLFATMAGFAFAKLRFRGKNALLLTVIATMMIPVQMGIIPLYIMMGWFGWQGELQSVILPFLITGFGVFMMRQYTQQAVPDELIEAARVDGCSTFRIYWSVVLPALRPAAGVLALLTFMQTWNDFMWPLAVLSPDNPTVQLSIRQLNSAYFQDYTLVFAGTTVATLPLLIVFVIFSRQIIGGIMEGAVKA
ncbi:cellobiose ABC transporter membrane protein [Thermomonospora echinospora]|uniref:Cellobiose ABC transporter membrane protein n=1 Tax=Thermomonospora echinospora TaxID=1992 RepID=A0A1H5XGU0_9ACTN|nr:carbohydrate ABC transporter permease [Thermomonospora echinospora]SEG10929.1 cellobiose ABC transporter membrane protein [Thermomonospora echinospora]